MNTTPADVIPLMPINARFPKYMQLIADCVNKTATLEAAEFLIDTSNANSRKAFTTLTGQKLPRTMRDSKTFFAAWLAKS